MVSLTKEEEMFIIEQCERLEHFAGTMGSDREFGRKLAQKIYKNSNRPHELERLFPKYIEFLKSF